MDLRKARGFLRSAVRAIRDENKEATREEVIFALSELALIRAGWTDNDGEFAERLTEIGLTGDQIPKIIAALDDRATVQHAVLEAWSSVEPQRMAFELDDRMADFVASSRCLNLVRARSESLLLRRFPEGNEFEPFVTTLEQPKVMAEVRAHTCAMAVLYVRSGHARHDLSQDIESTDNEFVQGLIDGLSILRRGEDSPWLAGVLDVRVGELLIPVRLMPDPKSGRPVAVGATYHTYSGNLDETRHADERVRVDGVMRDMDDPALLHTAAVTAGDLDAFGDWLARYTTGIANGIDLEIPPFQKGDHLARPLLMNIPLLA